MGKLSQKEHLQMKTQANSKFQRKNNYNPSKINFKNKEKSSLKNLLLVMKKW